MPETARLVRIPTLKTPVDFRAHVASLGIDLPCESGIVSGPGSPLSQPLDHVEINGKKISSAAMSNPSVVTASKMSS